MERTGSSEVSKMDAKFSANAKDLLGKRGLKEADVADVIKSAETSQRKITDGKNNIAKKRIGEVTVYAFYDNAGNVESAYSHRMVLGEPVKTTETPESHRLGMPALQREGHRRDRQHDLHGHHQVRTGHRLPEVRRLLGRGIPRHQDHRCGRRSLRKEEGVNILRPHRGPFT